MTGNNTAVGSTLPDELSAAQALLATLRQEQACLIAGDAAQIAALLNTKALQVATLSKLAAGRHQALATLGFASNEAGMQDWLAQAAGAMPAQWQALTEVVRDASEVNRVNGLLLTQQLVRNRQHLQVLGVKGAGQPFYGPNGQVGQSAVKRAPVQG